MSAQPNKPTTGAKHRHHKIPDVRIDGLDVEAIESRTWHYAAAHADIAAAVNNGTTDQITLFCHKTGAVVGRWNAEAVAVAAAVGNMPDDARCYRATHPAWLVFHDDTMERLQLLMPHEYCNYVWHRVFYTELPACDTDIGAFLHTHLTALYAAPLDSVIELAELLRRAAALLGKHIAALFADNAPTLPADIDPTAPFADVPTFVSAFRRFLADIIITIHGTLHRRDIERQRSKTITLSDISRMTLDAGRPEFKRADRKPGRRRSVYDSQVAIDIRELFDDLFADDVETSPGRYTVEVTAPSDNRTYHAPDRRNGRRAGTGLAITPLHDGSGIVLDLSADEPSDAELAALASAQPSTRTDGAGPRITRTTAASALVGGRRISSVRTPNLATTDASVMLTDIDAAIAKPARPVAPVQTVSLSQLSTFAFMSATPADKA